MAYVCPPRRSPCFGFCWNAGVKKGTQQDLLGFLTPSLQGGVVPPSRRLRDATPPRSSSDKYVNGSTYVCQLQSCYVQTGTAGPGPTDFEKHLGPQTSRDELGKPTFRACSSGWRSRSGARNGSIRRSVQTTSCDPSRSGPRCFRWPCALAFPGNLPGTLSRPEAFVPEGGDPHVPVCRYEGDGFKDPWIFLCYCQTPRRKT